VSYKAIVAFEVEGHGKSGPFTPVESQEAFAPLLGSRSARGCRSV